MERENIHSNQMVFIWSSLFCYKLALHIFYSYHLTFYITNRLQNGENY